MTSDDAAQRPDGGYETALGSTSVGAARGWCRQVLVVAETEYRLAVRGRWALAMTAIFATFSLGLATFSGASVAPEGFDRTVASLAVIAVYLVPLVALAFGYDAVVGREESGWLQALFALPVDRSRIVVGTVLGRVVVFASAVVIGFGITGGLLLLEFGLDGFDTYVGFLLATVALGVAFLAFGILLSTLAREKTHALGLSLLLWAWFVLVHDLLALGVLSAFDLPDAAVSALLVANPTGVYRALVLGALGAGGDAGFAAVLASAGLSGSVLVAALAAWIAGPIAAAAICIRRRRV
ncbi:ABC transporter permease [Halegenticoccus tardaugens]|uniref:ABC transporter permease n=1 Tax=Halegenticoccus tardaugens TaxID=2071624 RepID=UPI001E2B9461|nr:ABC transporter permease subunit [Halegenticoccus tardaugens]